VLSSYAGLSGENEFISLEQSSMKMKVLNSSLLSEKRFPTQSGVVGKVAQSAKSYLVMQPSSDPSLNPYVDIDSHDKPFYCVPIFDLNGNVIACFEAVPSLKSPLLRNVVESDKISSIISFEEAAEWVSYQISPLCSHILSLIGNPCVRPSITPRPLLSVQKITSEPLRTNLPSEHKNKHPKLSNLTRAASLPDEISRTNFFATQDDDDLSDMRGRKYSKSINPSIIGGDDSVDSCDSQSENVVNIIPAIHSPGAQSDTSRQSNDKDAIHGDVESPNNEVNGPQMFGSINDDEVIPTVDIEAVQSRIQEAERLHFEKKLKQYKMEQEAREKELIAMRDQLVMESTQLKEKLKSSEIENNQLKDEVLRYQEEIVNVKNQSLHSQPSPNNEKLLSNQTENPVSENIENNSENKSDEVTTYDIGRDWIDLIDDSGQLYYYNNVTGETSYERPPPVSVVPERNDDNISSQSTKEVDVKENEVKNEEHMIQQNEQKSNSAAVEETSIEPLLQINTDELIVERNSTTPYSHTTKTPRSHRAPPSVKASPHQSAPNTQRAPPTPSRNDVEEYVSHHPTPRYGDWIELNDDEGNVYYYNQVSGETSWNKPNAEGTSTHANYGEVRQGDWIQLQDAEGNIYWFNEISGESAWEIPVTEQPEGDEAYHSVSAGGYTIEL
jgi:hypothetical protein